MTKHLTHAEAVAKSREKSGAKGVNISMLPEERALLDALADRHGGIKGAVMAGLRALEGRGEISRAALLAEIERRLT